jgi:hypothetical protein
VSSIKRTLFAALVGLIIVGCGATALGTHATPSSQTAQAGQPSFAPAANFADLRNRPLNQPALAADGSCPGDSSHDVKPVVTSGKGGPNFGFGPGPAYLSGIVQIYPGAFDNEIWMIDASYRGPVLIRGHQVNGAGAVSFEPPTTFAGMNFSGAGAPPPGPAVATVTSAGAVMTFYAELDIPAAESSFPQTSWRLFFARTHIDTPGCYAFQLDGLTFSTVIVFHVIDAARPGG